MSKKIGLLSLFSAVMVGFTLLFPAKAVASSEGPPEVPAHAYVVMDAATGQVLVAKNEHEKQYPASITKVFSNALALSSVQDYKAEMDTAIEVSHKAATSLIPGAAHVSLNPGEVVSFQDMLHAAHVCSANDASNVLAEFTSGTVEAFAQKMNETASQLGLTGSHFVNPSGLPDKNHYTTAYDMAAITRWALEVPGFRGLFDVTQYTMQPTNKQPLERVFNTNNLMLLSGSTYYYEGITGSKSGHTDEARFTLVTTVKRGDTELICVVLKCEMNEQKYDATTALLDYCFDNFTRMSLPAAEMMLATVPAYGGGDQPLGEITVGGGQDPSFLLHNSVSPEYVEYEYELPERYVVGHGFAPVARLTLRESSSWQYPELGRVPLSWSGLEQIFAANTTEWSPKTNAGTVGVSIAATTLVILVLVFAARIYYVKRRRMKRQQARLMAVRNMMPVQSAQRPPVNTPRQVTYLPRKSQRAPIGKTITVQVGIPQNRASAPRSTRRHQ